LKLVYPFSTDTNALIDALKKIALGPQTIMDRRNVVNHTIGQLKVIAQTYGGIPGRKTMIFAAGRIPEITPEQEIIDTNGYTQELRDMWQNMIDANIAIYPVQLMSWARDPTIGGLAARPDDLLLYAIAKFTGGNRCNESNGLFGCMVDAVEDSRSYYMLGFSVPENDRKPGWRDLKVEVSEPHVEVRARDGFYYGIPAVNDMQSVRKEEMNALASPLAHSAVPMYVKVLGPSSATEPHAAATKRTVEFLVTIPLKSIRIDPLQTAPLNLEVGAIALTSDTREAGEFLRPVSGNPKPETLQVWARDGIKLRQKLDLQPGSFERRFLARDNNSGQIGTVVFPLEIK
jgi:hypothetical protein